MRLADGHLNIRSCGVTGDGVSLDTGAFSKACAAAKEAGGGTILVPPGRYLTGSIRLPDRTTLRVMAGAVILGSLNPSDYPLNHQSWEGTLQENHDPLIGAREAQEVAVLGEGIVTGRRVRSLSRSRRRQPWDGLVSEPTPSWRRSGRWRQMPTTTMLKRRPRRR